VSLNDEFLGSSILPGCKFDRPEHKNKRSALSQRGLCLVLTAWVMVGCGTPHATLQFTAPSTVTAGTPFTVTVTVLYEGKVDTVINSPVHFASSDPAAILPTTYSFTQSDAGSHTWTNGFVLATPGSQTISGYIFLTSNDTETSGINGSTKITVSP
jgi:hypothetical protein